MEHDLFGKSASTFPDHALIHRRWRPGPTRPPPLRKLSSVLLRRLPAQIGKRRGKQTDLERIRCTGVSSKGPRVNALRDRGEAKEREREIKG
jgi:hypothetical protein